MAITEKQRLLFFLFTLLLTFSVVLSILFLFPFSNLNLGAFNIHHLFIGAFLLVVANIFIMAGVVGRLVLLVAGAASALVLDEIVYLIATDGSDFSYLTPISFIGALILIGITVIVTAFAYWVSQRVKGRSLTF